MESVLHIEPITRSTSAPLSIGHTEYIFYGEKLTEDGENVGDTASHMRLGYPLSVGDMRLGSPLESVDHGGHYNNVPMVKTVECTPDLSRDGGNIYSETLHYFKDRKFLIPIRSKLRSGWGQSRRITHLPSLNLVREDLTGFPHRVCDPRSEIVSDILLKDSIFSSDRHHPLRDWINEELTVSLQNKPTNELSFDTANIKDMVNRYINQIHDTSTELSSRNIREIVNIISPEVRLVPPRYFSEKPICIPILDMGNRLINNPVNFKSFGQIPVNKLNRIEYNSNHFRAAFEFIDNIPLTDFNIDIVINSDNDVIFYHEHLAVDRFGAFADNEASFYPNGFLVKDFFEGQVLNDILEQFLYSHGEITTEIEDLIVEGALKIKIIKTITDEAAIFLYHYNCSHEDPPLCGVYFDIALLSLAPMSIIPEPILN